jgi:aminoglycoside phosphotransferase (APT) family kinase protein
VLDRSGSAQAFVKFTRNPQSHLMIRALDQLDRASEEPPFWFPRILDHGEVGDWSYTVTSTMRQGPHRPAPLDTSERRRVIDALQSELLDGGIGDGESTFPVHADFGPWNVRVVDRRIAIIDWEEMTTGPVAADELWHGLSVGLLKGGDPVACAHDVSTSLDHRTADEIDAAAAWWQARLRRPEPPEIEEGVSMPSSLESLPKRVASALDAIRKG